MQRNELHEGEIEGFFEEQLGGVGIVALMVVIVGYIIEEAHNVADFCVDYIDGGYGSNCSVDSEYILDHGWELAALSKRVVSWEGAVSEWGCAEGKGGLEVGWVWVAKHTGGVEE